MDRNVTITSAGLEGWCRALLGLVAWDSDHATGPPDRNLLQPPDPSISEAVEEAPCLLRCYIENINF